MCNVSEERGIWFSIIYRCSRNLCVADKAKVIYAPSEVYFPFGLPALLGCHFRSNPPLTNLRWEKDGYLFDPFNIQVRVSKQIRT